MKNQENRWDDPQQELMQDSRWFTVFGDVDDFIFYDNEYTDSQQSDYGSTR